MTEQQRYDVVSTAPGFEVRRYPAHVVAEIEVEGSFESAGNQAFRPLVSYISGQNDASRGFAMTAPVIQRGQDEIPLDSGAATTTTEVTPGKYVVSFVMPGDATIEQMPTPRDARVALRAVPEQLAAAARFSGRWSSSTYRLQVTRLLRSLEEAGLEVGGSPRFARFDPPWMPWFRRRNEVVVPLRGT